MEKKILVSDLKKGMYVSRLDRPWIETSFLIEGILIRGGEDIDALREQCEYVYVDVEKSDALVELPDRRASADRRGVPGEQAADRAARLDRKVVYREITSVDEELQVAKELNARITVTVREIMEEARRGNKIDVNEARAAVKQMKESILRNPNAFMLLRLVKDVDSYIYAHCLHVSALCIVFGRHLGLPGEMLDELAIGALLCDIGKTRVSQELLQKSGKLTMEEFEEVKQHVQHSVAIMEESGRVHSTAIDTVRYHHERYNGSGYLHGLQGNRIPVFGRMVSIVDSYDAMTSDRVYHQGISSYEAIRRLYGERNELFQESLVEHFIQAIGVYPVGAVVELSTGEVGIVISQNQVRRLRPKVMLVRDSNKQPMGAAPIIDLLTETTGAGGIDLEITRALEPGAYDIDPKEFFI